MIAHEEAAELQTRALKTLAGIVPELDLAIVVLEVAGGGSAADVTPLADDGIAEETIMCLVTIANEDGILDLTSYLDMRPKGCCAIDFGTDTHLGVMASGKTATDAGTLHHLDVAADVDGASVGVELGALHVCALFYEDALRITDDRVGR